MGRKQKVERNKAAYKRWKDARDCGHPITFMVLAKEFGIDVANIFRVVKREREKDIVDSIG